MAIVNPFFKLVGGEGLQIGGAFVIPWLWIWFIFTFLIALAWYTLFKIKRWHHSLDEKRGKKVLPVDVKEQLEELKRYRAKYGQAMVVILMLGSIIFGRQIALAETLSPPLVNVVSRTITNEDIFYLGGETKVPESKVVIYLQNLTTGETVSYEATSNAAGDWFYRHNSFLTSGHYQLWVQAQVGDELSPPSPQIVLEVERAAFQFGVSRLSYASVFLVLLLILLLVLTILITSIVVHGLRGRVKHRLFLKEIREAEESVRRGFAVLRRDINAELAVIKKVKLERELALEEKQAEERLLKDLQMVERYIGREIWEVEQAEA